MSKGAFRHWELALKRLVDSSNQFLSRNLLLSNTLLCCFIGGLGDVVLQSAQSKHQYDLKRTCHLTLTGCTVGPCFHFWYQTLDRAFPGRTISVIAKKVLLDQIVFSPICLSVFFTTLGFLDWSSFREIGHDIYNKGMVLYKTEWFVWPPAQMLNFYFVPLKYRVLVINLIAFCFSILQSHVKYSEIR